jgi:WD40 repeat protein
VLDEELRRLPEKYRAPLLLCCLEGGTGEWAARQLGWSLRTLRRRLRQGRDLLRDRLTRRGVAVPGALLAGVGQETADAAGPGLRALLAARQGCAFAAGRPVSGPAAALAEGVLRGALAGKRKALAVLVLTLGLSAAAGVAYQAPAEKPAAPPPAAAPEVRTDRFGDPLPEGAVARIGTVRFRHSSPVYALAWAPDGKALASTSAHGELRLWEAATGKLARAFVDPSGAVSQAVAFSPDGTLLASDKGGFGLWEVSTGKRVPGFAPNYTGRPRGLAFSPDGKTLALAAEGEPDLQLFSVPAGKPLGKFKGHRESVFAAAYAPDGKTLATGGKERTARVWDAATGKLVRRFEHPDEVTDVAFSPDGKLLAAGTHRAVVLWDVAGGKKVREWEQDMNDLRSLSFSPDGRLLASAGVVWDLAGGGEVCRCEGRLQGGTSFSPDGKTLATAGSDGTVRLHDPGTGKVLPAFRAEATDGAVLWAAFTPDARRVITLRNPNALHLWDAATGRLLHEVQASSSFRTAALSPDGKTLARVDRDGNLLLSALETGKVLHKLEAGVDKANSSLIPAVAFSPDGRALASAGTDNDVRVWDTATGRLLCTLRGHRAGVYFLAFSPDGKRLLSASLDHSARFWDVDAGKEARRPAEPAGIVRGISPDGRLWALSVEGNAPAGTRFLRLEEVETGREVSQLEDVTTSLCAFAPDLRSVAVDAGPFFYPDRGVDVHLVELATGKVRAVLRGHRGIMSSLEFSADGRLLVSANWDTTALVWDLAARHGAARPPAAEQAQWEALAGEDAAAAWSAMTTLLRAPGPAVAVLRERLRPVRAADPAKVGGLVKDLDDDRFEVRARAEEELEKLGESAAAALRAALEARPGPEARRRLERLHEKLQPARSPDRLRELRAVEVLEALGTPQAREVLRALAGGSPQAGLTREARAALDRLARRRPAVSP